jgi:lipopolysaccharide export system protein LptA
MGFLRSHSRTIILLIFLIISSLAWTTGCYAQAASKSANEEALPLNITADRLEVDQNKQVISFINKVVARYKDMILYGDTLKIFYQAQSEPSRGQEKTGAQPCPPGSEAAPAAAPAKSKTGQPGSGASPLGAVGIEKISRIEVQGRVRMVQGDRVATGDKAIYYNQEDKLVLLGNPQLWRGENSLKGRQIVFYVKENRAIVEGDPKKRVEAVIYPSQKVQLPGKQSAASP